LSPRARTRLTAVIVACALFMQNLDSTVVATALPAMARGFNADPLHMNVALTSYLLALAVFIPASGWVADKYGTRTVFRAAIAVFTLGSILCGAADTLWFLVFARVLQGLGGAMMVPVGRLVLLRTVPKSELVGAMAWLSTPAMIGPVVGPPLGGFIVTYFSWRWIFDINVPMGVLGILLVTLYVEDVREPEPDRFDGWGLLFSGVCLATLVFALETVGRGLVSPVMTAAALTCGVVSAGLYFWHATHYLRPVIDFALMRYRSFRVAIIGGLLFRVGIGAIPFLLPLMLQLDFGYSALQSGLVTFASSAGALVMKPGTTWALRRMGFRDTLLVNGILSALLLALMAAFRPAWPIVAIYGALLAGGFFRSLQFTAYNALAYAEVPRNRVSAATSFYQTMQQFSTTLGVSIGAGSLELARIAGGHALPSLGDFSLAFLFVAVFSLAAAPLSLIMPRDAGNEISGRHLRR
jgi:EmrB/QacA subfamily drug resistance transporter